jgi:hypothetical protein
MKTLIGSFTDISLPDSGRLEVYLYKDTLVFELVSARFSANISVNKENDEYLSLLKNLLKIRKGEISGGLSNVEIQLYRSKKAKRQKRIADKYDKATENAKSKKGKASRKTV